MSVIRVLRTASAVLTRTFYIDEQPTDPSGLTASVVVTRIDGTVVVASTAATRTAQGVFSFNLPGGPASPASATWQLDHLDVTWTADLAGAVVSMTDRVEVVGGFLFGLSEARAADASLTSTVAYPPTMLAAERTRVEDECERICRQAWVPRFWRETLSGRDTDRMGVRFPMLRRLRSVVVSGVAWSAPTVATVAVSESGMLALPNGSVWPAGVGNIVVEYEHGWDQPPDDLKEAAMARLRSRLNMTRSGVPDRASSYTTGDGATYRLTLPSADATGFPEVDAVYARYTRPRRAVFA